MEEARKKILYVAGIGRSGSTIIDDIAGQVGGFFSVGEVWDIWNQGCDVPCSCGKPLRDCETWVRIFRAAFGREPADVDFTQPLRLAQRIDRLRHLWWIISREARKIADRRGMFSRYLDITRRLYDAIFSVSGARVLVDSSKNPVHAYLLDLIEVADIYIVHLIRDPRAVAFSWGRPKGKWPPKGLTRTCMEWNANNLVSGWLERSSGRYLRIRYEDFVERPLVTAQRIMDFVGEPQAQLPFVSERSVELRPLHGYGGTPGRYTGRIEIVPDSRWLSDMPLWRKLGVTAMTMPGLLRYRYPINVFGIEPMSDIKLSGSGTGQV
jgi:hypothetical protein